MGTLKIEDRFDGGSVSRAVTFTLNFLKFVTGFSNLCTRYK